MKSMLGMLLLLTPPLWPQQPAGLAPATRADLALALLDFEAALQARPPEAERVKKINQAFDQATLLFFRGGFSQTVLRLRELTEPADRPRDPAQELAFSLRLRLDPPLLLAGPQAVCHALLSSLAPAPSGLDPELELVVRLRSLEGTVLAETTGKVAVGEKGAVQARLSVPLPEKGLAPGTYRVEVGGPDRPGPAWWPLAVVAQPLEEVRSAANALLGESEHADPGLAQARALCRSRLELLSEEAGESRSARLLADLAGLSGEVLFEAERIAAGENPYLGRLGHWWCALPAGSGEIPMRIYAPSQMKKGKALPLVIALHGAGGDENLFMAGYGAGRIAELAEKWGFLVASPEATAFLLGPLNLDRVLEGLGRLYPYDPERVYVLGHSMGAMAASGLARTRAGSLAAVCCMAGGAFMGAGRRAPILVIAGALDPLFTVKRMEEAVAQGRRNGGQIELRLKQDLGHTLLVGACLPEAVSWLLQHHLR